MAAVTVAAQTTDSRANPAATASGAKLAGCRHTKWGPITVATTGDTLATGITSIVEVAWIGVGATDYGTATFASTGVVTFLVPGGGEQGYLHVWSRS